MKKLVSLFALLGLLPLTACSSKTVSSYTEPAVETVVIVHGLGRSGIAMWRLEDRVEEAGYQVCTIDYPSFAQPLEKVINTVNEQIDHCGEQANSLHFIGHSLGGLLIRAYLQDDEHTAVRSKLGEVVMMGTPNHGSAIADHYSDSWWMLLLGETTQSLVTSPSGFAQQLSPPEFEPGIIAGTSSWSLSDNIFGEPNDGLVTVASTKLPQMKDFIAIDVNHSMMRYDAKVAQQAIYFLQHGSFNHNETGVQ